MKLQSYCSIDLEFTGFNPQVDQILEIGFVFFELDESGIREVEKWSQVFQPTVEVHEKILGLTGLSAEDLSQAPKFTEEHREFLQDKLGEAILVAHNPALDIKFLESYGLTLSGKYIDTLDLAQILLPTHHSYNLENLMHHFSITPEDSHRALSDAFSTIHLLDRLLSKFHSFEADLQKSFIQLLDKGDFAWRELFQLKTYQSQFSTEQPLSIQSAQKHTYQPLEVEKDAIVSFGLQEDFEHGLAKALQGDNEPAILVVPSRELAVDLWRQGLGKALFGEEELFSLPKFEMFVNSAVENDQIKFALKVLVWLRTNWQTESIADLNLTFFGGQFRSLINGGVVPRNQDVQLLVCAYSDLTKAIHQEAFQNRRAVIVSISGLEKFFSSGNSKKVSWNMALYLLRSVYNPESGYGQEDLKDRVVDAIGAVDLYFSLLYMLLQRHFPGQRYVTLEQVIADDYLLHRLLNMGYTLTEKLRRVSEDADSPTLKAFIELMQGLLQAEPGIIKWIEVSEYNTTFKHQSLDLASETKKYFVNFESVSFAERFVDQDWSNYLQYRLGLRIPLLKSKQFTKLSCSIALQQLQPQEEDLVITILSKDNLPALALFPDTKSVKRFYDKYYNLLNTYSSVLAQGYSGGPNKLFRNFAIKDNSILLISTELALKQQKQIKTKSCLIEQLPIYQTEHPYNKAVIENYYGDNIELSETLHFGMTLELLNKVSSTKLKILRLVYRPTEEKLIKRLSTIN